MRRKRLSLWDAAIEWAGLAFADQSPNEFTGDTFTPAKSDEDGTQAALAVDVNYNTVDDPTILAITFTAFQPTKSLASNGNRSPTTPNGRLPAATIASRCRRDSIG